MIETRGSFGFTTEAFHVRLARPRPKTDYFECDRAIETFLPGTKNDALTAATNLFEQLVIAEVPQHFRQTLASLVRMCWPIDLAQVAPRIFFLE